MNALKLSPNRTVVTSFTNTNSLDDGHYVLHLCSNNTSATNKPQTPLLTCALTNRCIYSYNNETLQKVHSIENAHAAPITDLSYSTVGNASSNNAGATPLIVSSSEDGFVKLFDLRAHGGTPALQMLLPKSEQALTAALGYGGVLAAVGGGKGNIHFYDLRNATGNSSLANPLGSYVDAHTDDVTRVRFQPGAHDPSATTPLLVSASEDGLVCIHDTSQPSEEKALKSVLNVQSPLREVGFFGPRMEGIYCLTGSETISVWHHESAQPLCNLGDKVRDVLTGLTGGGMAPIQYLVGCFWDGLNLNLVAGDGKGDCGVFRVDACGSMNLRRILSGGHLGCIRGFVSSPLPFEKSVIVTGGEDARLCEWNITLEKQSAKGSKGKNNSLSSSDAIPSVGGGRIKRSKKRQGHTPY